MESGELLNAESGHLLDIMSDDLLDTAVGTSELLFNLAVRTLLH